MSRRDTIIHKSVKYLKSSLNDYEKTLDLVNKHDLPVTYSALGSDFVHGAASVHNEKINLKDAYTPKTVLVRAGQRAAIGALIGAAASYYTNQNLSDTAHDSLAAAGTGALIGATTGPAVFYGVGKAAELIRQKTKQQAKQTVKTLKPILAKG